MYSLEGHIAWRYLRSKKSHNAINIVSGVSAVAVAVVTAAMICVLSVMNGFGDIVRQMFSEFDPQLRITAAQGKYFSTDDPRIAEVQSLPYIDVWCEAVKETALVEFESHQLPAVLLGVDSNYQQLTHIDSILVDGEFQTFDGGFERTVVGQGLAWQLGVGAHFIRGLHLYAPKRCEEVNMLRPEQNFNQSTVFISAIFAVNQVEYDDKMMLVSLQTARHLFDYSDQQVTEIDFSIKAGTQLRHAKREIRKILGDNYVVADQYEQQADFFRILRVEKLLTGLLLVFILLIAAFNLIGSLTMLMLDKQEDTRTLSNLGADEAMIRRIFLLEGWIISSIGAVAGILLGLTLCLIQQHFGLLKLGSGTEYILNAYPVAVRATDILIVLIIVISIGFAAAWYPTRHVRSK
ncbi:MAG: FtsX-like permease family protein [Paludibacteraceae bacterium]|nr:FtsX-like permease family protein [Paludibacteraceae bacterium]